MNVSSKPFYIYMIQVDHLTGENIGQAIDTFYAAGAANVQVVSSITKKNRPSYIFFIDCRRERAAQIEERIVMELSVGGWHRIETEHCYLHNRIDTFPLYLKAGGEEQVFQIEAKRFVGGGIRPEHDSVMRLRDYIRKRWNCELDYNLLYAYSSAAICNGDGALLEVPVQTESQQHIS